MYDFHREFHDWELQYVNFFLNHIYSEVPSGRGLIK